MIKIREFQDKSFFMRDKKGKIIGKMRCGKSVEFDNGMVVRYNQKGACWRIKYQPHLDAKIATSLMNRAMWIAEDQGKMIQDIGDFPFYPDFQKELVRMVGEEIFMKVIEWIAK